MLRYLYSLFTPQDTAHDVVGLFLAGHSVAQIAAALGASQEQMIPTQRQVESQIRQYVYDLEAQIAAAER